MNFIGEGRCRRNNFYTKSGRVTTRADFFKACAAYSIMMADDAEPIEIPAPEPERASGDH